MNESLAQHYLDDAIASFRAYKKLADKALDQIKDEEYFATLDPEANSIEVIMKHIAGNMFSRWTDFLTSDGEKPDRNRDMEFVIETHTTKDDLRAYWESGWQWRQMTHYAQHIGTDCVSGQAFSLGRMEVAQHSAQSFGGV
jgi:hypothetical protein